MQQEQDLLDEAYPSLFCRALYDYEAQDSSALSFRRGDIIEILTQQPSGWWDGLLGGDERGWFPSNYVAIISDEEAEMAFSGSDRSNPEVQQQPVNPQVRHSIVDMSHAMMRGSQAENEEWLDSELDNSRNGMDNLVQSTWQSNGAPSSDFWMPQVASNGQVKNFDTCVFQFSL